MCSAASTSTEHRATRTAVGKRKTCSRSQDVTNIREETREAASVLLAASTKFACFWYNAAVLAAISDVAGTPFVQIRIKNED